MHGKPRQCLQETESLCPADFINFVYTVFYRLNTYERARVHAVQFYERKFKKKLTHLSWHVGGKSLAVDKDCKHVM